MVYAQVSNERALTIPRKIGSKIGERHTLVTELPKIGVPDNMWPKLIGPEIYRA